MKTKSLTGIIKTAFLIITLSLCLNIAAYADDNDNQPVRFAVIGDRTGSPVEGIYPAIIKEIQLLRPDLLMTVGDQIVGYTDDSTVLNQRWAEYKKEISPLTMPIHIIPGNNDILSDAMEQVYREQVGDPYQSFDYCGIHFVILDIGRWENSDEIPNEQMEWLINDLDHFREAKYTFVFMHKPFWYNTTVMGKPDTLHTIFRNFGVDGVFSGHFHSYFTGEYDGIKYTNVGSSGGGAAPGVTGLLYHFCWVTVDEDGFYIATIKSESVLPWDEVTADDHFLAARLRKLGLEFEPVIVNSNLKPLSDGVSLKIRNFSPDTEIDDTLRWDIPEGWTVAPDVMPVKVAASGTQTVKFQTSCAGSAIPAPTAKLDFEFDKGKTSSMTAPLRLARRIVCKSVYMPPMIDGNIAEPIWKDPETKYFAPDGGEVTADPTAFYFAWDEENLYVAAKCFEPVMDSMKATVTDHDGPVYSEDCIGFFIQPNTNDNTVYQIYFNPIGFAFDQKITMSEDGYMISDRQWDGSYNAIAIHGNDFWTLEAAIPLSQLGTSGKPGKKIGINFRRKQARLGTSADWQTPIDSDPRTLGILIME